MQYFESKETGKKTKQEKLSDGRNSNGRFAIWRDMPFSHEKCVSIYLEFRNTVLFQKRISKFHGISKSVSEIT